MAKVVRNIELTEEEAQALVIAYSVVDNVLNDLEMTSEKFFDQLFDICDTISTGQSLNGKIIQDNYDDYEFKIVDK